MKKTTQFKQSDITPKWFQINAENQTLGRLATKVATIITGKHKPTYTPHIVSGDYLVITNAEKVKLTGNKLADKNKEWFTGHNSGLKKISYEVMITEKPEEIIIDAVKGMIPNNKLRPDRLSHLKVYRGSEHPHSAQKPELIKL